MESLGISSKNDDDLTNYTIYSCSCLSINTESRERFDCRTCGNPTNWSFLPALKKGEMENYWTTHSATPAFKKGYENCLFSIFYNKKASLLSSQATCILKEMVRGDLQPQCKPHFSCNQIHCLLQSLLKLYFLLLLRNRFPHTKTSPQILAFVNFDTKHLWVQLWLPTSLHATVTKAGKVYSQMRKPGNLMKCVVHKENTAALPFGWVRSVNLVVFVYVCCKVIKFNILNNGTRKDELQLYVNSNYPYVTSPWGVLKHRMAALCEVNITFFESPRLFSGPKE